MKFIQFVCLLAAWSLFPDWAFTSENSGPMPSSRCAIVDVNVESSGSHSAFNDDVEAIYAVFDAWRTAVLEGDAEAIVALVTEDAEFWPHGGRPIQGRSALADAFAPFLEQYEFLQDYTCEELVVRGNRAFIRGMERNTKTPRAGGEPSVSFQRAFSVLHRCADGQWRFARGMTNHPPKSE